MKVEKNPLNILLLAGDVLTKPKCYCLACSSLNYYSIISNKRLKNLKYAEGIVKRLIGIFKNKEFTFKNFFAQRLFSLLIIVAPTLSGHSYTRNICLILIDIVAEIKLNILIENIATEVPSVTKLNDLIKETAAIELHKLRQKIKGKSSS